MEENSFPHTSKIAVAQDNGQDSTRTKPEKIIRFAGDPHYYAQRCGTISLKYLCAFLPLIS
jgi:hypothetical protein